MDYFWKPLVVAEIATIVSPDYAGETFNSRSSNHSITTGILIENIVLRNAPLRRWTV